MTNLLLTLTALLLGTLLWRLGRRGKRLDNHPICRKCTYDLTGLPQSSTRCPECGTDLSTKNATRTGNRRPNRLLAWTGVLIALASLVLLPLTATLWWQSLDATPYLPFTMVEDRYKHGDQKAEHALKTWLKDGDLSKAQATKLVEDMTAWQDDPTVTILGWPFDVVVTQESDFRKAGVDSALLDNYTDHSFRIEPAWRQQVIRGSPIPIRVSFDVHPILCFESQFVTNIRANLQISGQIFDAAVLSERFVSGSAYLNDSVTIRLDNPKIWSLEQDGKICGTLVIEADFGFAGSGRHIRREIPFSCNAAPPGTALVSSNGDPVLNTSMPALFTAPDTLEFHTNGDLDVSTWRKFRLSIQSLPENVAAAVYFEQGDRRWPQGILLRRANRHPVDMSFTPKLDSTPAPPDKEAPFCEAGDLGGFAIISSTSLYVRVAPTDVNPNLPLYLVFDSNPTLAANHTAFDHIWQGQVRLPIKINIIKP